MVNTKLINKIKEKYNKLTIYRAIFAKKKFYKFNKMLVDLGLRGLGILNYENMYVSGENYLINLVCSYFDNFTCLDVGANIGEYSKKIKKKSKHSTVYSLEPHPQAFELLQKESDIYKYIPFNIGLSNEDEKIEIYSPTTTASSHATLYREIFDSRVPQYSFLVDLTTLDNFIESHSINRINLLKIDTEGHEYKVLLGASEALQKGLIDMIHFEFNSMNTASRIFFKDFYQLLEQFSLYRLLPNELLPLKHYEPLFCEFFAYQNIVAIHRSCNLLKI